MSTTLNQTEIYEFIKAKFAELEVRNLVKAEINEKLEQYKHSLASKADLAFWVKTLIAGAVIVVGALTYHVDRRFDAVYQQIQLQREDINQQMQLQREDINKQMQLHREETNRRLDDLKVTFEQQMALQTELILLKIDEKLRR